MLTSYLNLENMFSKALMQLAFKEDMESWKYFIFMSLGKNDILIC